MKKVIVLFILLTSNILITQGQNKTLFDSYLSNFKSVETDILTENDFSFDSSEVLSKDFVNQFISNIPECECEKEGLAYFPLFKIEKENFIITFVSKLCEMVLSEDIPYYNEKLLLVYSPQGKLIDNISISKEQAYQFFNYGGTWQPFNLLVKHALAQPNDVIRESPPYLCKYDTYQYAINPEGKIEKKLLTENEQGIVIWENETMKIFSDSNKQIYNTYVADRAQNETFEKYISNFKPNNSEIIDNTFFQTQESISGYFIKRFITDKSDCECLNEELWYQYTSKIEKDDFTIVLVSKNCDSPSLSGTYPYSDNILIVYSPKGEITDSKIISRSGDLWECNYSGNTEPFKLTVEQASVTKKEFEKRKNYPLPCKIKTTEYRISKKGMIQQTVISEKSGTIIWDDKKNKSVIAKEHSIN